MVTLCFCHSNRRYALDLVRAYANGVSRRVLTVFDDMAAEADAASDAHYEEAISKPADGDGPGADEIADEAHEHGFAVWCDLVFVSRQVLGVAVAGLYHLWERLTKEFLFREFLSHSLNRGVLKKEISQANFAQIVCCLREMGWRVEEEGFYSQLDRLHLIANVAKHGDGTSCDTLLSQAPSLFRDFGHDWMNKNRGADCLELRHDHFDECVTSVCAFFETFPEALNRTEPPRLVRRALALRQRNSGE